MCSCSVDKPGASTVQHNKLMPSEIYRLYEKIQQFDDNIKNKKQTKHTNTKVSRMSSSNTKRNKVKWQMLISLHWLLENKEGEWEY